MSTAQRATDVPSASYRPSAVLLTAAVLACAAVAWSVRHVVSLTTTIHDGSHPYEVVFFFAFAVLVVQLALVFLERPHAVTVRQRSQLDRAFLVANVPCYNEDPGALQACLASLLDQSRPVDLVHVVDDGSTVDYAAVQAWFLDESRGRGVEGRWTRQSNAGKRHAQAATIAGTPQADLYLTVDSDAILDHRAVEEGLKPFADPRVQSVAGVVMLANVRANILTRLTEVWFVVGQMVDRSAMSAMGGVLVNSGALAFYRGPLLRRHLDGYLHETFFGRRIEASDDSLLTIYALSEGRAVQQPTSFAFTLMPERYSHHRRQYLRWMRGAFIRSWWRFRYLPLNGYAYWTHLLGWVQMVLSTVTFAIFFVWTPAASGPGVLPWFLVIPVLVGWAQGLRYFSIRRDDLSREERLGLYLLVPVVTLYSFFVLRFLRYYAIATCLRTGWGTRSEVELTLTPAAIAGSSA